MGWCFPGFHDDEWVERDKEEVEMLDDFISQLHKLDSNRHVERPDGHGHDKLEVSKEMRAEASNAVDLLSRAKTIRVCLRCNRIVDDFGLAQCTALIVIHQLKRMWEQNLKALEQHRLTQAHRRREAQALNETRKHRARMKLLSKEVREALHPPRAVSVIETDEEGSLSEAETGLAVIAGGEPHLISSLSPSHVWKKMHHELMPVEMLTFGAVFLGIPSLVTAAIALFIYVT